jgi:hypothetical protein
LISHFRTASTLLAALALGGANPTLAAAQLRPDALRAVVGGYFESYEFLDRSVVGLERVSLITVPFAARAPVIDRVGIELRGTFAHATAAYADGTDVSLSGPTDTELRANVAVIPERLTLSAGVLLPTGNSTHTLDEAALAGLVAADLLPFRISNWGAGGGFGLASTFTMPAGDFALGLTAGYTIGREFEPAAEEEIAYRPGDELRVRLAVERPIGNSAKMSFLVGTQLYREDEFAGTSVYQPGNRVEGVGSLSFAVGPEAAGIVYAGVQHRGVSTLVANDLETPAQDLVLVGGGLRVPSGILTLVPALDLRIFRREDGVGQGHLASLGAGLEWPLGRVVAIPSLKARFGEVLLWEGAESPVRGVELGLGLRLSL